MTNQELGELLVAVATGKAFGIMRPGAVLMSELGLRSSDPKPMRRRIDRAVAEGGNFLRKAGKGISDAKADTDLAAAHIANMLAEQDHEADSMGRIIERNWTLNYPTEKIENALARLFYVAQKAYAPNGEEATQ